MLLLEESRSKRMLLQMFWQFICLTYDIIYDYSPLIMKFRTKLVTKMLVLAKLDNYLSTCLLIMNGKNKDLEEDRM